MESEYVRITVHVNNASWDRFLVSPELVCKSVAYRNSGDYYRSDFEKGEPCISLNSNGGMIQSKKKLKFCLVLNGIELSYFAFLLGLSKMYRSCVVRFWCNHRLQYIPVSRIVKLFIVLINPPQQIIDYCWNARISYLISERSELDTAMSWLSTLGGAYSALGDYFKHCAHIAGRISLQQFKIALRLGDVNTVARCKLFIALSMIQTKRYKQAQQLIKDQYQLACSSSCPDTRLIRMCRGVWSKLRYEHSTYKRKQLPRQKEIRCSTRT